MTDKRGEEFNPLLTSYEWSQFMQTDKEWLSLPETARVFRMNLNALKTYLSIHKKSFTPRQYRTRGPGRPGRCRVLSVSDITTLTQLRTERLLDNTPGRFDMQEMSRTTVTCAHAPPAAICANCRQLEKELHQLEDKVYHEELEIRCVLRLYAKAELRLAEARLRVQKEKTSRARQGKSRSAIPPKP
jgi:hypothetical protein